MLGKNLIISSIANLVLCTFAFAQNYVPGEVIVKLKGSSISVGSQGFMSKASADKQMTLKRKWKALNMYKYGLKPGARVEDTVAELNQDPSVEYAEPNYYVKKSDSPGIMGQAISAQDFEAMAVGSFNLTSADIQVDEAWGQISTTPARIVVAIIDTGVDMNHSAFRNWCAIWTNENEIAGNGLDDDGNGYVDDIHGWNFVANSNAPYDDDGHGTHVAGIVLGSTQQLGKNPDVMPSGGNCDPSYLSEVLIMPLKFLDDQGNGTTSDAIQAIYYAANNGAQILNNSWGGGAYSKALHEAIAYSYTMGTVFLAAAGNAASNNDASPMYPANYDVPNVVSVAASTSSDSLASFSNYGASTVHLAAPGVGIYSAIPGGYYASMSGTSMATPMVAGIAALIANEKPNMYGYQIKEILLQTTDLVSALGSTTSTSGRLNAYSAVTIAKSVNVSGSQPPYIVSLAANDRDVASAIASGGTGCGLVRSLNGGGNFPGGGLGGAIPIAALMLLPLLISLLLKRGENYRNHERFYMDSSVRMKVGEQEIVGSMDTISVGGAGVNIKEMMDQGSVVTMTISSPDGNQQIDVQGKIVWTNEARKQQGIQFSDADKEALSLIQAWTKSLIKA